jgi:pSer/pThr/pTyr-binding forkhead associated (FHA) protein
VNNQNVVSQKLLHGDRIRIGEHILLFVGTEKAKVEAETENIPLNQTVMIGVKPKGREGAPLPEMERPEFGIREVKSPRPYRRITPIFLAILIVIAGGWLLLSHGPFLMRMIFERTSSSGTVGDASKISDGEPINSRMDRTGPLTKKILEKPGASSPQEEDSSLTTSGDSEPAAGPREELVETSDPADGIVWSSDAEQSFAVINGTILKVGGSVEGAVVTDIGRNYVLLKSREDDSEIKLTIR